MVETESALENNNRHTGEVNHDRNTTQLHSIKRTE